jgi:hypothetical protein
MKIKSETYHLFVALIFQTHEKKNVVDEMTLKFNADSCSALKDVGWIVR